MKRGLTIPCLLSYSIEMQSSERDINIKNLTHYFLDRMINVKNRKLSNIKIDSKS